MAMRCPVVGDVVSCRVRDAAFRKLGAKAALSQARSLLVVPRQRCLGRSAQISTGRAVLTRCALDPHFMDQMSQMASHLPFATGVGLPCTVMNCGDIVYRSSLDPKLRMEETGVSPVAWAIIAAIALYLSAKPGALQGIVDYYILGPLDRKQRTKIRKRDLTLGKRLGKGGFGTVYSATYYNKDTKKEEDVVVKQAVEYGVEEAWMNERVQRACRNTCATFKDAFEDTDPKSKTPLWLVWSDEGANTFADYMRDKRFPLNLGDALFDPADVEELGLTETEQKELVIKNVALQLLDSLSRLHATGIVHRDIKPQNIVVNENEAKLKLIDLGAAADLRVGINYIPKTYLLDPRYAAPEKFIMSTSTPSAPQPAIAAFLSPILWQLNRPDKFDLYPVGIIILQMAFPSLRVEGNLVKFRSLLESLDWDITKWRKRVESKKMVTGMKEGFALLDRDNKAGWSLVTELMERSPDARPSAYAAANHRFLTEGTGSAAVRALMVGVDTVAMGGGAQWQTWLVNNMAKSGLEGEGFTEADLEDMGYKGSEEELDKAADIPDFFSAGLRRTIAKVATRAGKKQRRRPKGSGFKLPFSK